MLLIDGVKYEEYTPKNEGEFERMVCEHAQEIFGEHSLYFDRKLKLQSLAGVGSIPDGYAIIINNKYEWHIIEIELSSHPLYSHIVPQISKFITGINNPNTRKTITEAMYHAVISDDVNYFKLEKVIQTGEFYKFISDIVSKPPIITIVIEKDTSELHDALESLNHPFKNIVELRTFTREGIGLPVHTHLFEPLYKIDIPIKKELPPMQSDIVKITLQNDDIRACYIHIPKANKSVFPNFKTTLQVETNVGQMDIGFNPANWGTRLQGGLTKWFKEHPELKAGDEVSISIIEPMQKYRLEIVK